jgi:D-alanyl-D-alanine carboxypeptidase (penicillin-binding protein 5/6)
MRKFAVFLSMILLLCLPAAAFAEGPQIDAGSYLLMEKETGTVILSGNGHEKLEPASVTKIMTLLLVMEAIDDGRLSYDDMVPASAYAASMGGSQVFLKEGERLSVREMIKCVCVSSANDAAVALAEAVAGSEEEFVSRMNARAKELGMNDTTFKNCTGLPADGHVTSANDIALMSRELILKHPDIRQFTTIWMDTIRNGSFGLSNTNKLIRFYDGATGLKTGSTDSALFCLSGTAERGGMELIAVIMKAPTSAIRFEDAKALLNYGFANYALAEIYPGEALGTIPVRLGVKSSVQPVIDSGNKLLVEKAKLSSMEKSVSVADGADAPVSRGQRLGTLTVTSGGGTIAEIPIVAGEDVEKISALRLTLKLFRFGVMAA